MTPCKQCPSDPTEQSFAPTAFRAKLSLTFLTIHVLEYEASVTVKSLAYVLCRPGSRDILSPIRQSGEMNKSIPPGWNQPVYSIPLKTKIRHKTQNVNAKHLQCQCIVSGRSCGHSPCIFHI